jgi:hypothetical protein
VKGDNVTNLSTIIAFLFLTGQLYDEATVINVPTFIFSAIWVRKGNA